MASPSGLGVRPSSRVGDPAGVQLVDLLADGAVDGGVAGVEANDALALGVGRGHHLDDLLERHAGGVVDLAAFLARLEQLGVHEAARPDDDVGLREQALAANRDEVGRARSRPDKKDHV